MLRKSEHGSMDGHWRRGIVVNCGFGFQDAAESGIIFGGFLTDYCGLSPEFPADAAVPWLALSLQRIIFHNP